MAGVYLASPDSWCPNCHALQRDGNCSKLVFVHSEFYTPDESGNGNHLEFYIAKSVNTKIVILTTSQKNEFRASLEFYIDLKNTKKRGRKFALSCS